MPRLFVDQPRLLRSPSELPKERMAFPAVKHGHVSLTKENAKPQKQMPILAFPAVKHGHVSLTKENIKPLEQMTSPWPSSLPQGSWLANNLTWCHGNNTTVCHPQRLSQEFQKSSLVQKVQKVNPSYHTQINPIKRVYIHHMSPANILYTIHRSDSRRAYTKPTTCKREAQV